MMVQLSNSVKALATRLDGFENNINVKVNKLQSEFVLLKNKVEFIERNMAHHQVKKEAIGLYEHNNSLAAVGSAVNAPQNYGLTADSLSKLNFEEPKSNNFYGESFGGTKGQNPFMTQKEVQLHDFGINKPSSQPESTEELIRRVQSRF